MHDDVLCALYRVESPSYNVFARLCEHLNGDVVGNELVVDELAQKVVLRLRGGGEADFDLLEADFNEQFKELNLRLERHGLDKALVAVAKIYRAPDGRTFDGVLFGPVHAALLGKKILF